MKNLYELRKKIENIFGNKPFIIAFFLIVWILCSFLTLRMYSNTLGKESTGAGDYSNVQELTNKITISETIPTINNVDCIGIKFATYARKNTGNIKIVVEDVASKELLAEKTINVSRIEDNAFEIIELNKPLSSSNKKGINVSISSNSIEGKGIGVYYSNFKEIKNSTFKINNKEIDSDLCIRLLMPNEDLNKFLRIILPWLVVSFTFLVLLLSFKDLKHEVLFSVIALFVGLLFCFIMTPLSIPDEQAHYEFAFQQSNYIMGSSKQDHRYFDSEYQKYGSLIGHMNTSMTYKALVNKWNSELTLNNELVEIINDVDEIYNVDFIVPGLGITLGRLLKLNFYKTFYLGRLFNLMFYVTCVFIAIRKTPIHKLLFGILMVMPMFLQQAASYSYDCFVNGLSFVLIAYLLKFMFVEEEINIKEILFVAFVCSILSPAKAVYSFFVFLFWFVPYQRYKDKKRKILFTLLFCAMPIAQLLNIIVPVVSKAIENINELAIVKNTLSLDNSFIPQISETFTPDKKITVGYMVRHPFEIIMLILRTIRYSIKIWFYESLGRSLSGMSIILPLKLVHIMVFIPIIAAFMKEKYVEPVSLKATFLLVCIVIGLFAIGGMLMTWTDLDQTIIEDFGGAIVQGIQGRYFSPLLPYFFSIFNNKKFNISLKIDKYLIFAQLLVLFETLMYVLSITFIN